MNNSNMRTRWLRGITATVIAMGISLPALAETHERDNTDIIRHAFDAWAAGTGGPYDLLADDATWTITGNSAAARTYSTREAFLSEVIRPFNARMKTSLKPTIRQIYQDGDTVIVFFDASGMARDDVPYANTYAWFLTMRDGRIQNAVAFFDSITFDAFWNRVQPAQ